LCRRDRQEAHDFDCGMITRNQASRFGALGECCTFSPLVPR
jgi:hypothetical protein